MDRDGLSGAWNHKLMSWIKVDDAVKIRDEDPHYKPGDYHCHQECYEKKPPEGTKVTPRKSHWRGESFVNGHFMKIRDVTSVVKKGCAVSEGVKSKREDKDSRRRFYESYLSDLYHLLNGDAWGYSRLPVYQIKKKYNIENVEKPRGRDEPDITIHHPYNNQDGKRNCTHIVIINSNTGRNVYANNRDEFNTIEIRVTQWTQNDIDDFYGYGVRRFQEAWNQLEGRIESRAEEEQAKLVAEQKLQIHELKEYEGIDVLGMDSKEIRRIYAERYDSITKEKNDLRNMRIFVRRNRDDQGRILLEDFEEEWELSKEEIRTMYQEGIDEVARRNKEQVNLDRKKTKTLAWRADIYNRLLEINNKWPGRQSGLRIHAINSEIISDYEIRLLDQIAELLYWNDLELENWKDGDNYLAEMRGGGVYLEAMGGYQDGNTYKQLNLIIDKNTTEKDFEETIGKAEKILDNLEKDKIKRDAIIEQEEEDAEQKRKEEKAAKDEKDEKERERLAIIGERILEEKHKFDEELTKTKASNEDYLLKKSNLHFPRLGVKAIKINLMRIENMAEGALRECAAAFEDFFPHRPGRTRKRAGAYNEAREIEEEILSWKNKIENLQETFEEYCGKWNLWFLFDKDIQHVVNEYQKEIDSDNFWLDTTDDYKIKKIRNYSEIIEGMRKELLEVIESENKCKGEIIRMGTLRFHLRMYASTKTVEIYNKLIEEKLVVIANHCAPIIGKLGIVKWFNPRKGFGFIKQEVGDDLYVHKTSIRTNIIAGDSVRFEVGRGRKGPIAIKVEKSEGIPYWWIERYRQ